MKMTIQRILRPSTMVMSRRLPRTTTAQSLRRAYATTSKQPRPTSQFYKTFTRPIAKVLVLAVFTYQFIYWGWVKLETDEHQQKTDAEIADLEAKVSALDKARKASEEVKEKEEARPKKKSWW